MHIWLAARAVSVCWELRSGCMLSRSFRYSAGRKTGCLFSVNVLMWQPGGSWDHKRNRRAKRPETPRDSREQRDKRSWYCPPDTTERTDKNTRSQRSWPTNTVLKVRVQRQMKPWLCWTLVPNDPFKFCSPVLTHDYWDWYTTTSSHPGLCFDDT